MSTPADKPLRRRHDAPASRQALLEAAIELFNARGYDATTVREIGERAAVDPALIARYFGSKEGLYLAALAAQEPPADAGDPVEFVRRTLSRHEAQGVGPVGLAMVSPTIGDAMREQVRARLATRTGPLAETLRARGADDPELRAALIVATTVGVSIARRVGTLPALSDTPAEDVVGHLAPAIAALARP
ncbi:TetR/AcrR family transcriptional regulator [Candidatus Solirubrobacter pratensis]|uniref:TetR/AcrR family transcriptional regulator n=1 Tax=Candidatus Solirubrobacter pratensis TaxID=1298857 RepID=UPI000419B217|nr:TetR family transcriptional regulator [Candidatus Solirubrobacter pratensis]